MAVRASVGGAILSIVAKKMTPKALHKRTSWSWSEGIKVRKYASGRGEYTSTIRELNMLGSISGDREGSIVRVG